MGTSQNKIEKLQAAVFKVMTPEKIDQLLNIMLGLAEEGDREAARYLLDRVLGRPTESVDMSSQGEKLDVKVYIPARRERDTE